MAKLKDILRPLLKPEFTCPRCGHSIDDHDATTREAVLCGGFCLCEWSPSDIATWHLTSIANPIVLAPAPKYRPLGAWE